MKTYDKNRHLGSFVNNSQSIQMLFSPVFFSHELTSHNSREGMYGFIDPFGLNIFPFPFLSFPFYLFILRGDGTERETER